MNYNLVSTVGTCAKDYVLRKKPSELIPFRGKFPLLKNYEYEHYISEMDVTPFVKDLSPQFQEATNKGFQIYTMEKSFEKYLSDIKISVEDFKKLGNKEKADNLISWMNKSCLDFSSLDIN